MDSETAQWACVVLLGIRSIMQQIYIGRLKSAMKNIVRALRNEPGVEIGV